MRPWDEPFEKECHALVVRVCDPGLPNAARNAAWKALLGLVAPHVEAWAASSSVLRRCGLGGEDEARAVLVGVLARMNARGFDTLHAYLARQPAAPEDEEEATLVEDVARLARAGTPDAAAPPAAPPDAAAPAPTTPLRGWLFGLTRYAVKDHVKQRFGWTASVRAVYGVTRPRGAQGRAALEDAVRGVHGVIAAELDEHAGTLAVEYLPGTARSERIDAAVEAAGYRVTTPPDLRRSKRDLVTGADRITAANEPSARPPITDALTLRRLLADVSAFMETFPAPMRDAVRMWLDDEPFEAIAGTLGLDGAERGRALVRAGVARLRDRFRADWPMLGG